ncbi:MAG: acyl-ACP--UDP-N-acetylglucosamine O-acyltransferase [Acetobacteraceae bacterium]|nr:acyl-ACP--UDP-N-acetylglucosamine O-acyltransferase [Acetobacteraceae bacterium]
MPEVAAATEIHPGAAVAPGAVIGAGVRIGPWCQVGPDVVLEDGVELVSHVVVDGITRIGAGARLFPFATVGLPPQDLKYRGEPTRVEIGPRSVIREHVTIHRGTPGGGGLTRIGADCLLMCVVHIAHDCTLGDRCIIANNVMFGGHITLGEQVFIGGGSAIHQFVRIGRHAAVGGMSGVEGDVIPYGLVMGNRARLAGLNLVGLKRRGFARAQIHALRGAFRLLFRAEGTLEDRMDEASVRFAAEPLVAEVLGFMRDDAKRPLCRAADLRDADISDDLDEPDAA